MISVLDNFFQNTTVSGPPNAVQVNVAFPLSVPFMVVGVALTPPSGETVLRIHVDSSQISLTFIQSFHVRFLT